MRVKYDNFLINKKMERVMNNEKLAAELRLEQWRALGAPNNTLGFTDANGRAVGPYIDTGIDGRPVSLTDDVQQEFNAFEM